MAGGKIVLRMNTDCDVIVVKEIILHTRPFFLTHLQFRTDLTTSSINKDIFRP